MSPQFFDCSCNSAGIAAISPFVFATRRLDRRRDDRLRRDDKRRGTIGGCSVDGVVGVVVVGAVDELYAAVPR